MRTNPGTDPLQQLVDNLLTTQDVADELQVTNRTVQNLINRGELQGVRVGRLWRVRRGALLEYLERATSPA